jgi:hypothetical protein
MTGESGTSPAAPQRLHSLNAGLIIHRTGQAHYGYAADALAFGQQLADYMNTALKGLATTTVHREMAGVGGRVHWLVHLTTPADYQLLISMADNDEEFRHIYEDDRLPERGSGNWERMFVQSSFQERVLIPQHGLVHADGPGTDRSPRSFAVPASLQLPADVTACYDSGTAPVTVHRTIQAAYESRDLARAYLHEWQTAVNRSLPGEVTVGQYEEIWGRQDRLHLLIHLGSTEAFGRFAALESHATGELANVLAAPRVKKGGEALGWGALFEPGTASDIVTAPYRP